MYVVRNSSRALFAALVPLAVVHAALLAMAVLTTQTVPAQAIMPPPDKLVFPYAGRLALDVVLLFAGHSVLRQFKICNRVAYALIGGVMAATSYLLAMRNGLLLFPPPPGSEITAGLLPTAAGMLAGFLYGQFAGLEAIAATPQPAATEIAASPPRVFDGPVRVRSSVGAIAIAVTVPAALSAVLAFMVLALLGPAGPDSIITAALPAQVFLTVLIATTVPSAILLLAVHHIARAFGRSRGGEYAAIGSLVAAGCAVLLTPIISGMIVLLLPAALVNGAIMGALYRRFAGIEPVPLPEVVIATDAQALVGADHPSRRQHGVILSS
ncbi:hypothetical protein [Bradyrhizobium retamae]|uniref:Uncharacterized protein n=1 Tax=Bradyrhizobium retamae TaxID=1300035 RepID=A0A0R3MQH9_9BRAD|nr:hypothetical protein [Bradyrhizobium retamae]KRR22456.1 hypothetical protein CQ13_28915 [Bradyrhizobium retamae]